MDKFRNLACDITSHCNNRCVFCFNEWPKPALMEEKIFKTIIDQAYAYVEGQIFLACLFEPTLHPRFLDFLEYIPENKRDKFFFTSNISRKFPDGYFQRMARCHFHHINISLETLDEAKYACITRNTGGNFYKNLKRLVDDFAKVQNSPEIHFITMVTRDNKEEILELAKYTREECHVGHHEFRTPYFSPAISQDWLLKHTLSRAELTDLEEKLALLGYTEAGYVDLRFDTDFYRTVLTEKRYSTSSPLVPVWSEDGKAELIPFFSTADSAVPRISARGHFTADDLDYAYDLARIDDHAEFLSSVLRKITLKKAVSETKSTRKYFQERFKKLLRLG